LFTPGDKTDSRYFGDSPPDQHQVWFPLMNRIGTTFKAYASNKVFDKPNLRNAFKSVDYVTSFVRYGDFNKITLEAKASGAKIISFKGNPYADFWIDEGDQRLQAEQMVNIFTGNCLPRETKPVPDISETARHMVEIYERILAEK